MPAHGALRGPAADARGGGAAADQLLVYPSAGLLSPEIGNGDRVRLDGGDTDHEVVKVDGQDAKGPLTHRKLYVRELAS